MKPLIIATQNKGKILEYEQMLKPLGYQVFSLLDYPIGYIEEVGNDFRTNALIKAEALYKHTKTMVLADDSGLLVDALNGLPGVHSRRFSTSGTDHDNNKKLLSMMADKVNRDARFECVIALIVPGDDPVFFEGTLHGTIHTAIEGTHGFGYDPVFIPMGHASTLGTLDSTIKHQISHRKKALQKCLKYIQSLG